MLGSTTQVMRRPAKVSWVLNFIYFNIRDAEGRGQKASNGLDWDHDPLQMGSIGNTFIAVTMYKNLSKYKA